MIVSRAADPAVPQRSGGLALEDVDDEVGLALGCSALLAVGIGLEGG
jgi:hypothetical protein